MSSVFVDSTQGSYWAPVNETPAPESEYQKYLSSLHTPNPIERPNIVTPNENTIQQIKESRRPMILGMAVSASILGVLLFLASLFLMFDNKRKLRMIGYVCLGVALVFGILSGITFAVYDGKVPL